VHELPGGSEGFRAYNTELAGAKRLILESAFPEPGQRLFDAHRTVDRPFGGDSHKRFGRNHVDNHPR
jgi:hypothetical protein